MGKKQFLTSLFPMPARYKVVLADGTLRNLDNFTDMHVLTLPPIHSVIDYKTDSISYDGSNWHDLEQAMST